MFFIFRKTVNYILFKIVLGTKIICSLEYLTGLIVTKKFRFSIFLELLSIEISKTYSPLQRGEVPLYSSLLSDNSGNSPQMAAPRRSCEIDQSGQRFHVGCDNRCLLGNEHGGLHGHELLGRTLMILILTNQPVL